MNVLLCLLSDQHVPNLLSVHHFQPDRIVLVESTAMSKRQVAAKFLNALELGGRPYRDRCDTVPLDAEDSLESVRKTLQAGYRLHPQAGWTANLTGGTKPMSIATYEFFKALGGKLIYTNVARPAEIMDVITGQREEAVHRLGIKEFLAGYGFVSTPDQKTRELEEGACGWSNCASALARQADAGDVLNLSDEERQKGREKGMTVGTDRIQIPAGTEAHTILLQTFWNGNAEQPRQSSGAMKFLTGGWLEVFFWALLTRHADALSIWDVRLGLDVRQTGARSGNDFDVAFMHNHGLSMMECKSGGQEQDKGGDVLYKMEAVIRQFRALRVRSFLATTAPNVLDAKTQQLKENLRYRSEIYDCRILPAAVIRELAQKEDNAETIRQYLFAIRGTT